MAEKHNRTEDKHNYIFSQETGSKNKNKNAINNLANKVSISKDREKTYAMMNLCYTGPRLWLPPSPLYTLLTTGSWNCKCKIKCMSLPAWDPEEQCDQRPVGRWNVNSSFHIDFFNTLLYPTHYLPGSALFHIHSGIWTNTRPDSAFHTSRMTQYENNKGTLKTFWNIKG